MRTFLTFFGLLAISLTAFVLSAHAKLPDSTTSTHKLSEPVSGESEANRAGKSFLLTYQAIGFTPVISTGVNAGYYLDRNSLIQIEAADGTLPYVFFDIKATTVEINYKQFFGNSFYVKGGAGYRKIAVKNARFFFTNERLGDIGEAESVAVDLAIGNQWQWQNFTLGCDWVGYMLPVATLNKRYSTEGATAKEASDLNDSWNKIAQVGTGQLLRFYLGASF